MPKGINVKKGVQGFISLPKVEKQCSYCGKTFLVYPSEINAKYCSASCRSKGIWNQELRDKTSKIHRGNKHHLGHRHSEAIKEIIRLKRAKQVFSEDSNKKRLEALKSYWLIHKKPPIQCIVCGKKLSMNARALGITHCRKCCMIDEVRQKLSNAHKGEKSWRWKGGVVPLRKRRLSYFDWKKLREVVFCRDGYLCEICGTNKNLVVHHISRWEDSKDDSLENLVTVCSSCHSKIGVGMVTYVRT